MSAEAIVDFVNARLGTSRRSGQVVSVDSVIIDAARASTFDQDFLSAIDKEVKKFPHHPSMEYYTKYATKVSEEGADYAAKEISRLEGLIESDSVEFHKKRLLTIRKNILTLFLPRPTLTAGKSSMM